MTCIRAVALFALISALVSAAEVRAGSPLTPTDVFVSGTHGYRMYRIPALETAADGTLVALAEARKHGGQDPGYEGQDIDLVCKRSTDGGQTWSAMQVIEDPGEFWSAANPATILDRQTGRLWLLYLRCRPGRNTHTARPGTDDVQSLARFSDDHGSSWSDPIDLTANARDLKDDQWRASVIGPGGAIQTSSGRLIAPAWKTMPYAVFAVFSDDQGETWQRSGFVPGQSLGNESQLVQAGGQLLLDIRQQQGGHRWQSVSDDGGLHWSEPRPGIEVTAVACAIERLDPPDAGPQRPTVLWTGPRGPGRANLVARLSLDGGKTFGPERPIASGPAAYSDLSRLPDGSAGLLWERGVERGYQFISFAHLDGEFLKPEPPGN